MARSPYSVIRSNIMKKQKLLLQKGYEVSGNFNINLPKVSELGHHPSEKDVEFLREYEKQIPTIFTKKISDPETGNEKYFNYEEARKYERQQAYKKGQITKILNETADAPKYDYENNDDWLKGLDDIEYINGAELSLNQVRAKIADLLGYISSAKNTSTAKRNEEIVNGIGAELLDAFERAENIDSIGLAKRLNDSAMEVNADLDRAKTAYLEKDNGTALTERLLSIILGRNLTISEAKNIDPGYDETIVTDEYGEVIE